MQQQQQQHISSRLTLVDQRTSAAPSMSSHRLLRRPVWPAALRYKEPPTAPLRQPGLNETLRRRVFQSFFKSLDRPRNARETGAAFGLCLLSDSLQFRAFRANANYFLKWSLSQSLSDAISRRDPKEFCLQCRPSRTAE